MGDGAGGLDVSGDPQTEDERLGGAQGGRLVPVGAGLREGGREHVGPARLARGEEHAAEPAPRVGPPVADAVGEGDRLPGPLHHRPAVERDPGVGEGRQRLELDLLGGVGAVEEGPRLVDVGREGDVVLAGGRGLGGDQAEAAPLRSREARVQVVADLHERPRGDPVACVEVGPRRLQPQLDVGVALGRAGDGEGEQRGPIVTPRALCGPEGT